MLREKLLPLFSPYPMDQQGSPCDHNFLTITPSYHSKVSSIDELYTVKIAEAVLLYVFKLDGVSPVDNRPLTN